MKLLSDERIVWSHNEAHGFTISYELSYNIHTNKTGDIQYINDGGGLRTLSPSVAPQALTGGGASPRGVAAYEAGGDSSTPQMHHTLSKWAVHIQRYYRGYSARRDLDCASDLGGSLDCSSNSDGVSDDDLPLPTQNPTPVPQCVAATNNSQQDVDYVKDGLWVSLCGGMDCLGLVACKLRIQPSHYISVESTKITRNIATIANPKTKYFPGVDHSWASNLMDITKTDVQNLVTKYGKVSVVAAGPPCQDHTVCRLLPPRFASDRKVGRPGFAGDKGKGFKHTIEVITWFLEDNPTATFLVENVDSSI